MNLQGGKCPSIDAWLPHLQVFLTFSYGSLGEHDP